MKRIVLILLLFACMGTYARNVRDTLGTGVRVTFVENLGQWDEHVRFEAQLHNAAIFLEDDGITVALSEPILHPAPATSLRRHAYKMRFVGSTPTEPHALQQQSDYYNYFIGNDPSRWRSKVPAYGMVRYNNIYPGIDLELFTASNALKYNLVVAAGADATAIVIEYDGADGVTASGDLRIATVCAMWWNCIPTSTSTSTARRWRCPAVGRRWDTTVLPSRSGPTTTAASW